MFDADDDRRLKRIEEGIAHLHDMQHHTHDLLHAILDAVQPDPADKQRLAELTASLNEQAGQLKQAVADNPVPK